MNSQKCIRLRVILDEIADFPLEFRSYTALRNRYLEHDCDVHEELQAFWHSATSRVQCGVFRFEMRHFAQNWDFRPDLERMVRVFCL